MAERPNPGAPKTVSRVKRLGKYELLARIGVGGMAEVYLARQRGPMNFEKVVVVKTIHPHLSTEKKFIDMLLDEARIAALIKHPRVVDIYDLGETEGLYFIAMEYLVGQPLSKMIKLGRKGKPLDVLSTAQIIADAADGLHAAHELKSPTGKHLALVHRDVSPGNIIVLYDGSVKLLDFGVSKAVGERYAETQAGKLKGKLGYLAPEQIAGDAVDRRCDIFSLGVVLWEALAMSRLFRATTAAELVEAMRKWRPDPPSKHRGDVPPELDEICVRALAQDPRQRYQTAREMRLALLNLLRAENYHPDSEIVSRYMEDTFGTQRDQQQLLLQQLSEGTRTRELSLTDLEEVKGSNAGASGEQTAEHAARTDEQTDVSPPPAAPARPSVIAPGRNPAGARPTSLGLTARPQAPAPISERKTVPAAIAPRSRDTIDDDATSPSGPAPVIDAEITTVSPPPVTPPPNILDGDSELDRLGVKATLPLGLAGQLKTMMTAVPPRPGGPNAKGVPGGDGSPQRTDSGWAVPTDAAVAAAGNSLADSNVKATVLDPRPFGANLPPLPAHVRSRQETELVAPLPAPVPAADSFDSYHASRPPSRGDDVDMRAVHAWPPWVKPAVIGGGVLLAVIAIALWTGGGNSDKTASTRPGDQVAATAAEASANKLAARADTAIAEPPPRPEPVPAPVAPVAPEPAPAVVDVPVAEVAPDAAVAAPEPTPEEPPSEAVAAVPQEQPRESSDERKDRKAREREEREDRKAREREDKRERDKAREAARQARHPADPTPPSRFERTAARDPVRTSPAPAPAPTSRWDKPTPTAPVPPVVTPAAGGRRSAKTLAGEYYQAGVTHMVAGDLGAAKRKFRTALSVSRGYAPAYRGLGIVHERAGDRSSAVRAFKQYLRLAPRANDAESIRKRVARLGG